MSKPTRRWRTLSAPRRLVVELMRASRGIPLVTAERRVDLGELIAMRRRAAPRPAWSVIFAKAFAIVASTTPALRTSFFSFPWAHLCEHSDPVAGIALERDYRGEEAVLFTQIPRPHTLSLVELDAHLRHAKEAPLEIVANHCRALGLAELPWPLRRLAMWLALHVSGHWRERFFGTFGLSSPAVAGAGLVNLISPLGCSLHYGLFDEHGRLNVRLTFDHRVLDGATAARALAGMEGVLHGAILEEMRGLAKVNLAA